MKHGTKHFIILALLMLGGFTSTFYAGYLTHYLTSQDTPTPLPLRTQSPQTQTPKPSNTNTFEPYITSDGEHYFDDTIIAISPEPPHVAVIATLSRAQEANEGYYHVARVSYYNGKSWTRKIIQDTSKDSQIKPNELLLEWNHVIDNTRVLKEQILTKILLNDQISIRTQTLENEISMRSLPGYTKLLSEAEGTLTINSQSMPVKILSSKIYSLNSNDIHFYTSPLGITTDWLILWTQQNEFIHVDSTTVKNPIPLYNSHQIAVLKNSLGGVYKTYNMQTLRDNNSDPKNYNIFLSNPILKTINLQRTSFLNKAPNSEYTWNIGHVKGEVTDEIGNKTSAFGLMEYIKD
jgi:hypothetical protein